MKKLVLLSILSFAFVGFINAQEVCAVPEPTPVPPTQKGIKWANDLGERSDQPKLMGNHSARVSVNYRKDIHSLYRKPTKSELELLTPDNQDLMVHSSFIKGKRRGVTKLIADIGCASNPKIVVASKGCAKYTMPGAGAAYSFRFGNYRIQRFADLNFRKNTFEALGILIHGMLVNLGDVSLDKVTLQTNGMKFINDFKPVKTISDAARFANKLTRGIDQDGFRYSSILSVKPNSTYVLRSVAYRGSAMRKAGGVVYNELGRFGDKKRKDVIIAFRVIRFSPNEAVTIVWKQLKSKSSPEIKK